MTEPTAENEKFVVDSIIEDRLVGGVRKWKVAWQGYDDQSWEPHENVFHLEIFKEYEEEKKKKRDAKESSTTTSTSTPRWKEDDGVDSVTSDDENDSDFDPTHDKHLRGHDMPLRVSRKTPLSRRLRVSRPTAQATSLHNSGTKAVQGLTRQHILALKKPVAQPLSTTKAGKAKDAQPLKRRPGKRRLPLGIVEDGVSGSPPPKHRKAHLQCNDVSTVASASIKKKRRTRMAAKQTRAAGDGDREAVSGREVAVQMAHPSTQQLPTLERVTITDLVPSPAEEEKPCTSSTPNSNAGNSLPTFSLERNAASGPDQRVRSKTFPKRKAIKKEMSNAAGMVLQSQRMQASEGSKNNQTTLHRSAAARDTRTVEEQNEILKQQNRLLWRQNLSLKQQNQLMQQKLGLVKKEQKS